MSSLSPSINDHLFPSGICSYSLMCPKCHCSQQLLALSRLSYPKTFDLLLRIQFPKNFFPAVVRYLNAYTGIVLLRCRKEFYQLVWSALPFITHLENKGHRYPCFLNTLHVGGRLHGVWLIFGGCQAQSCHIWWVDLPILPRARCFPLALQVSEADTCHHKALSCARYN